MNKSDLLKELRSRTQAGMKDCHDALREANDDLEKAVDIVKAKGLNIVSGRQGKVASEGMVSVMTGSNMAVMVEVNCQTDFVANNADFKKFTEDCAGEILIATLHSEPFDVNTVEQERQKLVSTTKENVVVRRWWVEEVSTLNAKVFDYVHSNNKIGVLLTLLASSSLVGRADEISNSTEFVQLGNDLAMQVAAMNPAAVSSDRLPQELLDRQKTIFETQIKELNKPQAAWAKILEGKFNKWHTEVCLLDQESVVIPKTTVKQVIANVGIKLGGEIRVVNFIRCQVGEDLEVTKDNLAEEVAKLM